MTGTWPRRAFFRITVALLLSGLAPDRPAAAAETPESPHGSFQADCNICHAPEAWTPAKTGFDFDHSQFGYDLEGAHVSAPCLLCHLTLEFAEVTGSRCVDCHQDVHAGELGTECDACHSTRSFIDRTDDLRSHRFTRFPLTGVHRTVDCASCHAPDGASAMRFANTSTDCFACHAQDYATATPEHSLPSFPHECQACHSTFGWGGGILGGGVFDHSLTRFPLTGGHVSVDCNACHGDGRYEGTPTDCFACHAADYQAASPVHTAPFFPTNCVQCHSTATWSTGAFDHDMTAFPLTGAHTTADCAACHVDGRYTGTATDCFACHAAEYNATTAPNHLSSGFGTDCAACHGTSSWLGAPFDHDTANFPIYSGRHQGLWGNDCATCHTQPSDFRVFTCFDCHQHNATDENSRHQGIPGYSYDSAACYSCHPQGEAD